MAEIEDALGRLTAALQAYANVVRDSPELPKDVIEASNQAHAAGIALQDSILEVSGWHIRLFAADEDDAETDTEQEDGRLRPPPGQGLAIRIRTDFVVTDPDRLLAAGRAAYQELWPDDPEQAAHQHVDCVEAAIGELLHRHPVVPLAGTEPTTIGLAEAGTFTAVDRVEQVLDNMDSFPDNPADPFATS
jgi:hypothetical protein